MREEEDINARKKGCHGHSQEMDCHGLADDIHLFWDFQPGMMVLPLG